MLSVVLCAVLSLQCTSAGNNIEGESYECRYPCLQHVYCQKTRASRLRWRGKRHTQRDTNELLSFSFTQSLQWTIHHVSKLHMRQGS